MTTPTRSQPKPKPKPPLWRRHTAAAAVATSVLALIAASCADGGDVPTPEATAGGSALYQTNCASCHGTDLRGTDRGPSHLSIVYEPNHHGDDAFRSAIVSGARQHHWYFGDMPPIAGLDDAEIDEIISYVRSEQEAQGFEQ